MAWAPDYVTAIELDKYVRHDDPNDPILGLWATTASRNVDSFCGRQFGQVDVAEDRVYTPTYDRNHCAWFVDIDDIQDITGLTVTGEAGDAVPALTPTLAGYQLLPRNAAAKGKPYERLKLNLWTGDLTMNGRWGWTATPAAVKVGLLLQANRLSARVDSPFGVAGSPSDGTEVRLLAQLDPDFRTALKPLRRNWWAA